MRIGMTASGLRRGDEAVAQAAAQAGLDGLELVVRDEFPADRFWDPAWRR